MLNSPLLSTLPAFGYDSSLYELSPKISSTETPWTQADLRIIRYLPGRRSSLGNSAPGHAAACHFAQELTLQGVA